MGKLDTGEKKKKKGKKSASILIDTNDILYILKEKDDVIKGKIPFNEADKDTFATRFKKLRLEVKQMAKEYKVKEFSFLVTDGIRLVKVIDFKREVKLNNDVNLLLREEIAKYIPPTENINEFEIHYLKTGRKTQQIFLTALIRKKTIMELNLAAIQDNVMLDKLLIPEVLMYELIKNKSGVNLVTYYDEDSLELRSLVCKDSNFLYASQATNIYEPDIPMEVTNLADYLKSEFKVNLNLCYLVGADTICLDDDTNILRFEKQQSVSEEDVPNSKYSLLQVM